MEQKQFKLKEIKADKGTGSAIIAEFNVVDHDGDVTVPGAFGTQEVNVLPAHDRMAPRLGKAMLKEDGEFAVADFKFNLADDAVTAKEWYSALKFDMENGEPLQEWSYGFDILEADFGQFQGKEVRFLRSLKVFEISPVLRGAGIGTGTLSMKDKNEKMTVDEQMKNATDALNAVSGLIERIKSLNDLKVQKGQKGIGGDRRKAMNEIGETLNVLTIEFDLLSKHLDSDDAEVVNIVQEAFVNYQYTLFKVKQLSGVNIS